MNMLGKPQRWSFSLRVSGKIVIAGAGFKSQKKVAAVAKRLNDVALKKHWLSGEVVGATVEVIWDRL